MLDLQRRHMEALPQEGTHRSQRDRARDSVHYLLALKRKAGNVAPSVWRRMSDSDIVMWRSKSSDN